VISLKLPGGLLDRVTKVFPASYLKCQKGLGGTYIKAETRQDRFERIIFLVPGSLSTFQILDVLRKIVFECDNSGYQV